MVRRSGGLGFSPATEDQAAEGEAEAEGAYCEAADREGLAPRRESLPAAERLALLTRQGSPRRCFRIAPPARRPR